MTNTEEVIQPSSDSFWEVGKYSRTVDRIDNGYKLCDSLRALIKSRSEIEKSYAKQLTQWSKKWNDFLDKGPEYNSTQRGWRGILHEADSLSDLHTLVADNLMTKVYTSIKQWQKENYHKSMMHFKETKELDESFKKAQKPWEKKYRAVAKSRTEYHSACKNEKSTSIQENNARNDDAVSPDQLKKIQEKLRKHKQDVENLRDKYDACLNDLNGYNAKYIEDMTEVFSKCQDFEKLRIDFFRKTMFDIHECVDLSSEPRFSQVYSSLHNTISKVDSDEDLAWWAAHHGADMSMSWPQFEEYIPDLASISKKEKKSHVGNSDGITITSIKHKSDSYQMSTSDSSTQNPGYGSQSSRNSQISNSSATNDGFNSGIVEESRTTEVSSNRNSFPEPVNNNAENPFGGDSMGEDEEEDDMPSITPAECCVPVKAVYDYEAKEEDELALKCGECFTMIKSEDELGWCYGRFPDGREGLYPAKFAQPENENS